MKILAKEPTSFTVGEAIVWKKYLPDYPPSRGYELFYYFRSNICGFDIKATKEDDYYLLKIIPEDTKNIIPALYYWQAIVVLDDSIINDNHIVGSGKLTIEPNFLRLQTYDGRSHVKQVLDALEATILNKASRDQLSYSIAGRSLSRLNPGELLKWRDVYKAEYARELQQERLDQGLNINNSIKVRFTNPY